MTSSYTFLCLSLLKVYCSSYDKVDESIQFFKLHLVVVQQVTNLKTFLDYCSLTIELECHLTRFVTKTFSWVSLINDAVDERHLAPNLTLMLTI